MGEAMVVIREYVNEMEALVARSVLEAHEIPAVVLRDDAGGMLPSMHLLYPVRLAVRTVDSAQALRILDAPSRWTHRTTSCRVTTPHEACERSVCRSGRPDHRRFERYRRRVGTTVCGKWCTGGLGRA